LAGCCECGDEPSGSGATELVSHVTVLCLMNLLERFHKSRFEDPGDVEVILNQKEPKSGENPSTDVIKICSVVPKMQHSYGHNLSLCVPFLHFMESKNKKCKQTYMPET
jgi:hypothetical protein